VKGASPLAWALACLGLAACAQPSPTAPAVTPARAFRPVRGTAAQVCSDAPGRACEGQEAACEESCGDGDAASCLGLARHLRAGGDGDANREKRAKRSLELTRVACTRGLAAACQALALDPDAAPAEKTLAVATLEQDCAQAAGCGCVALGEALLAERADDRRTHGLDVLDAACARGAVRACDLADETVYRCVREHGSDAVCVALDRAGRTAAPAIAPTPLPVPPAALGCFEVHRTTAPRGDGDHTAEVCVAVDRLFARAQRGPWDGWRCAWSTTGGVAKCKGSGPLPELRLLAGGGLVAELHGEHVVLRPLATAATKETLAQIAKLPSIEGACAAADRCVGSYSGGYSGRPATSLLACGDLAREMRKRIGEDVAAGRKGSHPEQCPDEASR
jgi:hypothetical protein